MGSDYSLPQELQGVAIADAVRDHCFVSSANPAMRALERVMTNIALTSIPVLLTGESGTGKEEVAVRIHHLSGQRNGPFVKMICASLTPDLLAELTRELKSNLGLVRPALPGTIFLDEVGELSANAQATLLHLLPDADAIPNTHSLRARIISATSQDIEREVSSGRFRKELYYRLKGVCLQLPTLRERREDIPALVDCFLDKHSALLGRPRPTVSGATLRMMQDYDWPGNIRELENVIKKVVAIGDEGVAAADLASRPSARPGSGASREQISLKDASRAASRQAERELIQRVLTRVRWNRKRAAQELQISYKALLYKLKQMQLDGSGAS